MRTLKTLTITIHMDGSAFDEPGAEYEVGRILERYAAYIQARQVENAVLRDINGNHCGQATITETA